MRPTQQILDAVRSALASKARIDLLQHHIDMSFGESTLTLEGEVASVAAKKLALEQAVTVPEVEGIIDRLHVAPAQPMGDGEVRDKVVEAFVQEPAFARCAISSCVKGEVVPCQKPPEQVGAVEVAVEAGVVTLNGEVPGLDNKRLAGVLTWWVPGSRDVINGLAVEPPEEDSFDLIAEGVRLALEKDPFIEAGQIRVGVRGTVVTLAGVLPSEAQRHMAECDAWYVFGVDKVVNNIEVKR